MSKTDSEPEQNLSNVATA